MSHVSAEMERREPAKPEFSTLLNNIKRAIENASLTVERDESFGDAPAATEAKHYSIASLLDKTPYSHGGPSHDSQSLSEAVEQYAHALAAATHPFWDATKAVTESEELLRLRISQRIPSVNKNFADTAAGMVFAERLMKQIGMDAKQAVWDAGLTLNAESSVKICPPSSPLSRG